MAASEITLILERAEKGDSKAAAELLPLGASLCYRVKQN
jgi:hypothetical protein